MSIFIYIYLTDFFVPCRAKEKKQKIKDEKERKKEEKRVQANDPLVKMEKIKRTSILRGKQYFNIILY